MSDRTSEIHLIISNQFTNRADIMYTPKYETLFDAVHTDPNYGMVQSCEIWNDRHQLLNKSRTIIDSIKLIMLFFMSIYLHRIQKSELIIFVMINRTNIFGFLNVI